MFPGELNKKAWQIRRESAQKWDCPVMEISWKHCLQIAREESSSRAIVTGNQILKELGITSSMKEDILRRWGGEKVYHKRERESVASYKQRIHVIFRRFLDSGIRYEGYQNLASTHHFDDVEHY